MNLGIPIDSITTTDGVNCLSYLDTNNNDTSTGTSNSTNSTRRVLADTTNTTNSTNTTNTTNTTISETTINIVILPNIDPNAAPGVTTDDILAMDEVDLKDMIQTALGTDYTVDDVTSPVVFPITLGNIDHAYTTSSTENSITISGIQTDNSGVVCYIVYQGAKDATVADVQAGTYDGKAAISHGCKAVDNVVSSDDSVTINGLSDNTQYEVAYTVRSIDDREYAQTTDVNYVEVTTKSVSVPTGGEEEEFSFLTTFGFLSFLLLIVFNAWEHDCWIK